MSCNHCDDPACTKVCPTAAMHKDPETGLVSVDADKCIGCGYCHMACPYNAQNLTASPAASQVRQLRRARRHRQETRCASGSHPLRAAGLLVEDVSKERTRQHRAASGSSAHPNLYIKPATRLVRRQR